MLKQNRFLRSVWPRFFFHRHSVHLDSFYTFSDYRQIWGGCICILAAAALVPLFLATLVHYRLIQRSVDSDLMLRTERLTSNAKRSLAFFIDEHLDALTFTANEMGYDNLTDNQTLKDTLNNLKLGFGGFTDLSIIDASGNQIAYAGPFNLEGKNYRTQSWFIKSLQTANFVSEVFNGYRDAPHIIVAVKSNTPQGASFILRATLDIERLRQMLLSYKGDIHTDIFLINHNGILQTPSTNFGAIFNKIPLDIPKYSDKTTSKLYTSNLNGEKTIIIGSSYISTEMVATPFILTVRKEKEGVMNVWLDLGRNFNWIIGLSSIGIIIIVTLISSYMINKLYLADHTKAETMLQMEQSQQLASIGQLAASVAHEINNPLALINETAGYVKDLYSFTPEERDESEIVENIDSILEAVERCGTITRQLLGFVRQFDITTGKVNLADMISNVLNFHKKEAEYKGIGVSTFMPDIPPIIETDSGKLQQILVNLINNAFQAVEENGCLEIIVTLKTAQTVEIKVKDTGCGISPENLIRIQEPFFSTKKDRLGTGLGLSITYGLVKKLQGHITVESLEGVGTEFTVTLPVKTQEGNLA